MELGSRENLRSVGDKCHAARLGDYLVRGLSGRTRHWYGRRHRSSFFVGKNLEAPAELLNSLAHALDADSHFFVRAVSP
jgi:hypothetical protein